MKYRCTLWVFSCLGVLLSTTSLAQAHTRWLVIDSILAEGDADVTEASDVITDVQPSTPNQLEDEFWSEALQNVKVSSALDTDEDIPTLTAEGSFILPTYVLPEADERKGAEKPAFADASNPWRKDGVVVGEASVIETPTLDHVEEQYAQTEDLLAQTSTRLETIETRIRELQAMNAQIAQETQEAVDAETERLAANLPVASQPAVTVQETPAPVEPVVLEAPVAQPIAQPEEVPAVTQLAEQTPAVQAQAVQAQLGEEVSVKTAAAEQVQTQREEVQETKEEIAKLQEKQIKETKEKIAKLQQTVEYAGLQVAYQDTTALLNNTAKKLKGLENDLAQLKQSKENEQKAKLVEDQYQKTAELLSVTTAQLESVERRMAELDAQEAQLQAAAQARAAAEAASAEKAVAEAQAPEVVEAAPAEEVAAESSAVIPDAYESPVVVEQPTQVVAQAEPIVVSTPQAQQPVIQAVDTTAIQLQNAADALANATARLEALEARLTAAPHETNLAVSTTTTPCPKKRPWLLPVEAIEEETVETAEDEAPTPVIPSVKNDYVDRVLQAIDRFEKNRTSASYADDVMLRTIPNEIKINFQPGRAELSAQSLKWVRVFSSSMRYRSQNAIEIRMGMQQLELQARRFALLKAALLSNGVSPRQIRFTLTNRDNDSVVLRVIPLVQEVDIRQQDDKSGQKVKQVIYQW